MSKKNTKNTKLYISILGIMVLVILLIIFLPSNVKTKLNGGEFLILYNKTANAQIVDVRTPAEFNAGHIDNAINIDFDNSTFKGEIDKLDKSKTYFIYCRSGNRSGQAFSIMKGGGIKNIYDLQGGIISNTNSIVLLPTKNITN